MLQVQTFTGFFASPRNDFARFWLPWRLRSFRSGRSWLPGNTENIELLTCRSHIRAAHSQKCPFLGTSPCITSTKLNYTINLNHVIEYGVSQVPKQNPEIIVRNMKGTPIGLSVRIELVGSLGSLISLWRLWCQELALLVSSVLRCAGVESYTLWCWRVRIGCGLWAQSPRYVWESFRIYVISAVLN